MIATKPQPIRTASLSVGRSLLTLMLALAVSAPALAANTLRDISYSVGAGGVVDIIVQLDGPATDAQLFTTDDPPRIAIDFVDTTNAFDQKRIAVGQGSTSAITAVEAGGRTRVVIDLFKATGHDARAEGNRYVIRVDGSGSVVAAAPGTVSPDPAKRLPASGNEISNIDFRRGDDGAGRVILSFSGDGAIGDLSDSGDGLMLNVSNARLPDALAQRLDVTDFATPVQSIQLRPVAGGARLDISTSGSYESLAYQSGSEYVVEISPRSEEAAEAAGVLADGEKKKYSGVPVTFNFQDIPVRTVLQLIAEESERNIVAADSVTGNVTLRLINVPWDQALDIVLRAKGLDQREDGNVVWVAPQSEIAGYEQALADARLANEQRAKNVSEYIAINYGSAEEIANLLTEGAKQGGGGQGGQSTAGGQLALQTGFLSPRGSVSFDRRTNTLLLNDSEEKIREIKALIEILDRPVDQVLIEARIVIASETFRRELGARFGISGADQDSNGNVLSTTGSISGTDRMSNLALINRFNGSSSGLPVSTPAPAGAGLLVPALADRLNVNLPVSNPAGAIGFAILGADYLLDLELSALEAEGRGEVVTSPRVITANQREATIKQGDEIGYTTLQTAGGQGGVANFTTEFKEVLLELKVTPTITQDGRVFLALTVAKDELTGFFQSPQGRVPEISTREISTAVLVDNGQTVVIGGVYEFRSSEDLTKVPFLGDVPVIGNLFKTKAKSSEKAELLIFVTPKVLAVAGKR